MKINIRRNTKYWLIVVVLLFVDTIASWIAYSRVFSSPLSTIDNLSWILIFLGIYLYWVILFFLNNRYKVDPTLSRIGEIQSLFKITLGSILIFVIYNELIGIPKEITSRALLEYWMVFIFILSFGRLGIRQVQKLLLHRGIGRKKTVIVGINKRAQHVAHQLRDNHLGYDVLGHITLNHTADENWEESPITIISNIDKIKDVIDEHNISEVIIALEEPNHDRLLEIISQTNGSPVSLKIIPDMYEVVSGLAKTEQIYGLPLIKINPDIMTSVEKFFKRLIDIFSALVWIVVLSPIWLTVAIAIKLDTPGSVFYPQERIGLKGRRFILYKFRSMIQGAEDKTGPVWAEEEDPRITKVGKVLRRFRLDEVPQFINVLKGDMSLIGPRPERPHFVQQLMEQFPFYHRRFYIRPGITGWAQIKHSYDSSIEDVREKLKYDFFYIENLSLGLDLKIMLSTLGVMLSGKGQ